MSIGNAVLCQLECFAVSICLLSFCRGVAVTKQRDAESGQHSLFFQIDYPEIAEGVRPRHRFMSAYEQRVEPPDRSWQYLLFAAEPYETIAFKVRRRSLVWDISHPLEAVWFQGHSILH